MANRNKARGNRLERVVAKALSEAFGVPFNRTPNSGAWGKAKTHGDVVCLKEGYNFPFSVECKKTDRVQLELLLRNPVWSDFTDWWKQTCLGALRDHKHPMLVMSHNQGMLITVITLNAWTEVTSRSVIGFKFWYRTTPLVITNLHTLLESWKYGKD